MLDYNPLSLKTVSWKLRRGGDSNSRDPFEPTGFRNQRVQPLCHLSNFATLAFLRRGEKMLDFRYGPVV